MNKNKIIAIAVIALLLALAGWKYYSYTHPDEIKAITEQRSSNKADGTDTKQSTERVAPPKDVQTVDIPEKPISGVMKGVVEVGASGFNSFVVNIDQEKHWEIVSKDFGESLAYEGLATTDDIKSGLKKYISNIFNKGVSGRNVHFVMSSGALKNPKTLQIANEIQHMGYMVNKVTPEQEGRYALKATLPPVYRQNSFVVDMGSGNTKISWYEGNTIKTVEAYGAKYYQNTPAVADDIAYQDVLNKVRQVPSDKRTRCFIIGGVPFQLAKESRENSTDRYTFLGAPDDYSASDDVKKRSGLNLYNALVEGSGTNTFVFDWDANFTIGFLLNLN